MSPPPLQSDASNTPRPLYDKPHPPLLLPRSPPVLSPMSTTAWTSADGTPCTDAQMPHAAQQQLYRVHSEMFLNRPSVGSSPACTGRLTGSASPFCQQAPNVMLPSYCRPSTDSVFPSEQQFFTPPSRQGSNLSVNILSNNPLLPPVPQNSSYYNFSMAYPENMPRFTHSAGNLLDGPNSALGQPSLCCSVVGMEQRADSYAVDAHSQIGCNSQPCVWQLCNGEYYTSSAAWSNRDNMIVNNAKFSDVSIFCESFLDEKRARAMRPALRDLRQVRSAVALVPSTRRPPTVWTHEENEALAGAVNLYGTHDWKAVANHIAKVTNNGGKAPEQCSQHWTRVINPAIVKGKWSKKEDEQLIKAVLSCRPRQWRQIAEKLTGRTDIQVRYRLKKMASILLSKGILPKSYLP